MLCFGLGLEFISPARAVWLWVHMGGVVEATVDLGLAQARLSPLTTGCPRLLLHPSLKTVFFL